MCARSGEHLHCVITSVFLLYVDILFFLPLWRIRMINSLLKSTVWNFIVNQEERKTTTNWKEIKLWESCYTQESTKLIRGGGGPTEFFR